MLGLSDRQAAEAVRCRIDFMYAMVEELDDPGFHHSAPTDFRDCLAEDGRADRPLDLAPARLEEAGLVGERTDSTHALAAVRELTRAGDGHQAVREVAARYDKLAARYEATVLSAPLNECL